MVAHVEGKIIALMKEKVELRLASEEDAQLLSAFLNLSPYVHRHLDWCSPTDWLGDQPFPLLVQDDHILAALSCPPDPSGIAWIRLFATSNQVRMSEAWRLMFNHANNMISDTTGVAYTAVALRDWMRTILYQNGFDHYQDIVVLEWEETLYQSKPIEAYAKLRVMEVEDLPAVVKVDNAAFSPIWRNSYKELEKAFQQSAYSTVIENDGAIIGYQISTHNVYGAHLARLAVHPLFQNQKLGYCLVQDLLEYFERSGVWRITVNTQSDNHSSLALYKRIGFVMNGERFPVYIRKSSNDVELG